MKKNKVSFKRDYSGWIAVAFLLIVSLVSAITTINENGFTNTNGNVTADHLFGKIDITNITNNIYNYNHSLYSNSGSYNISYATSKANLTYAKDYNSLTDAIRAAGESGVVILEANKSYDLTRPINFSQKMSIIGQGSGSTTLNIINPWSGGYVIGSDSPGTERINILIKGIKIDCNSLVNDGIWFNTTKLSLIEDVFVTECLVNNFHLADNNFYTKLDKVRSASNSVNGILIEDNEITIQDARIGDAVGINITQPTGFSASGFMNKITLIDNHVESGTRIGIYVDNGIDVDIYNTRIENYPNCVYLTERASNVRMFGGRYETCTIATLNTTNTTTYLLQQDNDLYVGDAITGNGLIWGKANIRSEANMTSAKTVNNWLDGWRGITSLASSSFFFDSTSASTSKWFFRNGSQGYLEIGQNMIKIYGSANFTADNNITFTSFKTCNLETDSNGAIVCGTDDIGSGGYNVTYDATSQDVTANRTSWINNYNSSYDAKISYNSTFNQTLTDARYALIGSGGNLTFNQSLTDLLYGARQFGYNHSSVLISQFGTFWYNLTTPAISYADTKAGVGSCAAGFVVQNTTTSGVQCVPVSTSTTNDGITINGANITAGTIDFLRLPTLVDRLTLNIANITGFVYNHNETSVANAYTDSRGFITNTNVAYTNISNNFARSQNVSGNITIRPGDNVCLDGDACTKRIYYNGSNVIIQG